jgi:hypothetical protein
MMFVWRRICWLLQCKCFTIWPLCGVKVSSSAELGFTSKLGFNNAWAEYVFWFDFPAVSYYIFNISDLLSSEYYCSLLGNKT